MRIDFFEEFPTDENLSKAALLPFSSTIYVAARSLREFENLRAKLLAVNPRVEAAYWPTLSQSYWISPFSNQAELRALQQELQASGERLTVLLDLELPLMRPVLFLKNVFAFRGNKRRIREILSLSESIRFVTAEYPLRGRFFRAVFSFLGISFPNEKQHRIIPMYYTSMIRQYSRIFPFDVVSKVRESVQDELIEDQERIGLGLGATAKGIMGNEAILSIEEFEADVEFCRLIGARSVTIFRLGGLTVEHLQILSKYAS